MVDSAKEYQKGLYSLCVCVRSVMPSSLQLWPCGL